MSRPPEDTRSAFSVSQDTRVRLPLTLLGSLFLACAVATAAWISVRAEVATHTVKIEALETEARSSRELLVRIDENVKQLKETSTRWP